MSLRPQRGTPTGAGGRSLSLRPHRRPARPKEVDLTDLAAQQQRPIEELQRSFRAAREPVEQTEGVRFPAGAEIKRAPAPGLLEKVGNVFRRGAIGRALGLSDLTAQAQAPRPTAEPIARLSELLPGKPTATITGFKQPSKVAEARALVGEGPYPYEMPEIPIGGIAKGALEVAESLTTPENVAIIATLGLTAGALPLLSRMISAGFSFELLRGAIQEYPELREAMNSGDEQRVAQVATRMGLGGILSALAGAHAVRGRAAATGTVEPEVRVAPPRRLAPAPQRRALPPARTDIVLAGERGVLRPSPPTELGAAPTQARVPVPGFQLEVEPALAPAPGLRAPVAAPRRARKARREPQQTPEQQRAAAAWERVLREEAPPPEPAAPKPLPKGVTEEMVQAELGEMAHRGLGKDRPTAIATVERMQRRQAEATQPLPEPQPVSPREAAELGVSPERYQGYCVGSVRHRLRRQRQLAASPDAPHRSWKNVA